MTNNQTENRGRDILEKQTDFLEKGCTFASSVFFVIMLAIIAGGTFSRYFFARPLVFVDEYSGYLFIAMGFLAMVSALKRDLHITVDIVTKAIPEKSRTWLNICAESISLIIASVLFWLSLTLCYENYQTNMKASTIMETPLWIPQFFIPLGWVSFMIFIAVRIRKNVKAIRNRMAG